MVIWPAGKEKKRKIGSKIYELTNGNKRKYYSLYVQKKKEIEKLMVLGLVNKKENFINR